MRSLKFFLAIFSFMILQESWGSEPKVIYTMGNASGLLSVNVPFDVTGSSPRLLQYNYSIVKPRVPVDSPVTIVWLGGGPAEALVNHQQLVSEMFPPEVQVLLVEYRGFGVNKPIASSGPGNEVTEFVDSAFKDFNSDTITTDVIEVLKSEKIEKYILFGQSFGTIVATKLAALSEQNGLKKPFRVVLEGSIAKSPTLEEAQETAKLFNVLLKQLDTAAHKVLQDSKSFDYTRAEWDILFRYFVLANGGDFAVDQFNTLIPYFYGTLEQIEAGKAYVAPLIKAAKDALGESYKEYGQHEQSFESLATLAQRQIAPKILLSEIRYDSAELVLRDGTYSVEQNQFDESLIKHFNPFDSSKWQISSPVYYIHGELDTATYLGTGKSHANSQFSTPFKCFSVVENVGHSPLSMLDSSMKHQVWLKVISGKLLNEVIPNSKLDLSTSSETCKSLLEN